MAGAFTHFVISDFAKEERTLISEELWQLLNKYYPFLFLGTVSPDLPYLSFKTGSVNWADVQHYEKTNSIVQSGHNLMKERWSSKTPNDESKLVWLMGYVSHLVADATIHPIVQAIVGPYEENKQEHRLCEMTQDSVIYKIKMNDDIRYTDFSEMISFCGKSPFFNGLMEFWKGILLENYSDKNEEPHPELWFDTYSTAIKEAEGATGLLALFRHVGISNNLTYRTKSEIETNYPQYLTKYYAQVKLPNGNVGSFENDGYQRTLINVATAWKKLYDGLASPLIVAEVIKDWDLDTGVDMDSMNKTVTYWG